MWGGPVPGGRVDPHGRTNDRGRVTLPTPRVEGDEPEDPRYESLSPQERRILELVADGLTNRQIGAEMYLAEKTVKNYVSSLLHKLGLGRRTEAAVYATERRQHGRPTKG